jgi:Domain of unknown function (DUF4258)
MKLIFRKHALIRMFERRISEADIRLVIARGEVIAEYPDDNPYPSQLYLGWIADQPLHVLIAKAEQQAVIVITAYRPDAALWDEQFKRKR